MTIRDLLYGRLLGSGLFDSQAEAVLQMVYDEGDKELKTRWHDNYEDYNPIVIDVLWVSVCRNTLKFIDANCPKHWARNFFVQGSLGFSRRFYSDNY